MAEQGQGGASRRGFLKVGGAALVGGAAVFGATRLGDSPAQAAEADTSGTTTLRKLNGFADKPASLTSATLIMVDYQNTYTRGVMELDGWQPALDAAAELLSAAREAGGTVIHIVNDGGENTPYDIRRPIGRIHDKVKPAKGERTVVKKAPNAFVNTDLGKLVDRAGNENLVIAGFMTHMCVTFTAEGAFLRGNKPTVVADACATRPLPSVGGGLSADQIHQSALATIADLYGVVVPSHTTLA
ncbi:Nicotinamidase-related amidase [Streptomyces sp. cf386]|uniref:cysteine hydrolase family protein n=1 Tax=Streptomyces sp. cf386 TaxID=1761904 RepID=UPI00087EA695|nr:cysteine hydrolase family protein [Streptomyces sp. cf386]SDP13502.1 Nicotinamidase-related amidase [Streptomyces sp. cf386]